MELDAAASLRQWAVWVNIGGREYRIPAQPAGPWLMAIGGTYRDVVPGMVAGLDADDLLDMMVAGRVTVADLDEAARCAIEEMAGTRWWSAARLIAWLLGNWTSLGSGLLAKGIDPTVAPLGSVVAVTYRLVMESCKDDAERRRIDMELDKPPVGVPIEEMYDEVKASSAFMALAARDGTG